MKIGLRRTTPPRIDVALPCTLVGRDRALAELRSRLRQASKGQRQIVFVIGEPGVGKTASLGRRQ
ncbi:MAG: AAA family ATPase [Steroidobacteraceae bacterium]